MRLLIVATALLAAAASGCTSGEEQEQIDRGSIEAMLEAYLPLLADAYATGEIEPLRGIAAEKEMAAIEKRVHDLVESGRVLRPTFHRVTIEDVTVFNRANAYVTTVEVWDIRVVAAGTDQVMAEDLGQSNRVKYQLKRQGESWLILFRAIQE